MNNQSPLLALEPGYELHWYRIERVLGQGAFGITYLAHDINLDRQVAIKEYLPGQFSSRNSDLTVRPTTNEHKEDFEWGLTRFISEARTLTKFEHLNLVRVFNVFEMNKTAYMVMNYEVGKSLQQILKSRKTLSESEIMKILFPLMSGLELMHSKGFVHRDIKPGNIFIRGDGSPVLLDFGSARQTRKSPERDGSEEPQTLTTLVSPGFAPIEQYGSKSDRQGPWTDIYGLGATLYRCVTGLMPVAAVDRGEAIVHDMKDPYLAVTEAYQDRYSKNFLAAIDHAMAFKAQDRPQNIAGWRNDFGLSENEPGTLAEPDIQTDTSEASTVKLDSSEQATFKLAAEGTVKTVPVDSKAETVPMTPAQETTVLSGNRNMLIAGTAVAVLVLIGAFVLMGGDETEPITEIPVPEIQTQIPEPEPAEIVAVEEAAPETPEVDTIKQQQIQELLRLAQEDTRALRLTSPKDNNAFDKYLSILSLDENNADAKLGIQSISDKYVALAYGAMDANKLDNAESYLKKASAISPGMQKVATAEAALQAKRAEQKTASEQQKTETVEESQQTASTDPAEEPKEEPNEGFWNKVKKWHQEDVERNKQYNREDSTDERMRRALGGK